VAQPGAHNEQVGAEPTGRLLNMAARDEAGETDSHEPETLDEIIQDSFGSRRLGDCSPFSIISGDGIGTDVGKKPPSACSLRPILRTKV